MNQLLVAVEVLSILVLRELRSRHEQLVESLTTRNVPTFIDIGSFSTNEGTHSWLTSRQRQDPGPAVLRRGRSAEGPGRAQRRGHPPGRRSSTTRRKTPSAAACISTRASSMAAVRRHRGAAAAPPASVDDLLASARQSLESAVALIDHEVAEAKAALDAAQARYDEVVGGCQGPQGRHREEAQGVGVAIGVVMTTKCSLSGQFVRQWRNVIQGLTIMSMTPPKPNNSAPDRQGETPQRSVAPGAGQASRRRPGWLGGPGSRSIPRSGTRPAGPTGRGAGHRSGADRPHHRGHDGRRPAGSTDLLPGQVRPEPRSKSEQMERYVERYIEPLEERAA